MILSRKLWRRIMNKKTAIISLLFLFTLLSCQSEEILTLTQYESFGADIQYDQDGNILNVDQIEIKKTLFPKDTENLVFRTHIRKIIKKIEGLEKFKNVKRLVLGYGLADYDFINLTEFMKNIEVLIIERTSIPLDLSEILKQTPNLKILYINRIDLHKPIIDLSYNNQIEALILHNLSDVKYKNMNLPGYQKMFNLKIKKLSDSLRYFDIHESSFVKLNNIFFEQIENCPYIVIDEKQLASEYNEIDVQYVIDSSNIKILSRDNPNAVIDEYASEFLYSLLGVSQNRFDENY